MVGVYPGAQESGGATWAERASAKELRRDAGERLEERGRVTEGVGDLLGFDRIPLLVLRVSIVVRVNGGVGCSP